MKRTLLIVLILLQLITGAFLVYNFSIFYPGGNATSNNPANDPSEQIKLEEIATAIADLQQLQGSPSNGQLIPELSPAILSLFAPLPSQAAPSDYQLTPEIVNLGRHLYYDPRLSVNHQISCNTCHLLDRYGVDSLSTSIGHDGEFVDRNAQSVYNAALHISQFWDGRSPTVEDQAKGPIVSLDEMGMGDPAYVEEVLRSIPGYQSFFQAAFPDNAEPITFDNAAKAIGAFERGLMTPSRFDLFLSGDYTQLNEQEQRGLLAFATTGCANCHMGVTVGGLFYKKLGEIEPYDTDDPGRARITGSDEDLHVFKVASLRNVAQTAPYLHDGSIKTIQEMIILMARHQLGKELTNEQVAEIALFLNTLTGEIPYDYIAVPDLPASGPDTPVAVSQTTQQ